MRNEEFGLFCLCVRDGSRPISMHRPQFIIGIYQRI